MGQKTNPTALRLSTTNHYYKSCWHSDYFYSYNCEIDLQRTHYIKKIFQKVLHSQEWNSCLLFATTYFCWQQIYCFLPLRLYRFQKVPWGAGGGSAGGSHNALHPGVVNQPPFPGGIRATFSFLCNLVPSHPTVSTVKTPCDPPPGAGDNLFAFQGYNTKRKHLSFHQPQVKDCQDFCLKKQVASQGAVGKGLFFFFQQLGKEGVFPEKRVSRVTEIQRVCHQQRKANHHRGPGGTLFYPIKFPQITQSSEFLAERTCHLLQKRISFNRLRRQILWQATRSPLIKGVRVLCSGRVESKSKKAQKALQRGFQWGETELHVYSSLVQFTQKHLQTSFGLIGVKLWVCYR